MYKEYLAEFWYSAKALEKSKVFFSTPTGGIYGEVGVNTLRNAIGTHYLPHSSEYVAPLSIDIVRPWFETIGYGEAIPAKRTLKKSLLPPRWSEVTKCGSFKAPTGSKTGHLKRKKESNSAMDSNPSQTSASTIVVAEMHKEDHQATGGPTSLRVTSEAIANPKLSSDMLAFNLNEPIYLTSFIIHSESASGNDASAVSTVKADPGNSAPSDFVPQQQGMNEGTRNTSYDHLFAGTDQHVLANQTKSLSEGLEIILTQPITGKGASSVARQIKEETSSTIKLEDLAKMYKLKLKKNKAEAKAALLKAQPSFPNVGQLNELLIKYLQIEFSKILSPHDFSSSLPTELKDPPSKFDKLPEEIKGLKRQGHELEIELPVDLKEISTRMEDITKNVTSLTSQVAELKTLRWELPVEFLSLPVQVASVQAKLKTLDALPGLLLNVTKALNRFTQVLDFALSKARDQSVPLAGQADNMPAEGEKNTNQATISQLF
nr:hypothetical protein [Tanacetum cinerariifolium]